MSHSMWQQSPWLNKICPLTVKQHWISWVFGLLWLPPLDFPHAPVPCPMWQPFSGLMGWCTATRCDRRMVAPVHLPSLSHTHTHIYHRAMTETNSGAARPVSLTGSGKTALHRQEEREKEGVTAGSRGELSWKGKITPRWNIFLKSLS